MEIKKYKDPNFVINHTFTTFCERFPRPGLDLTLDTFFFFYNNSYMKLTFFFLFLKKNFLDELCCKT